MDEKKSKDLIWLNQPIDNDEDDIIGVSTIVDKLESAVDNGAQMIALTSSFGSGKSSIIELFEKRRNKNKNERTIKLSMWSQLRSLSNDNEDLSFDHTLELHKSFVYQLVSTINTKRGRYVGRRLSPNFKLFKIHTNSKFNWILLILSVIPLLFAWVIHTFPEYAKSFPFLAEHTTSKELMLFATGIAFLSFLITKAEIISSFINGDNKRVIESTDIMDVFRCEVLEHKVGCSYNTYYVVIEDLDRTEDCKAVLSFLKELRKYYVNRIPKGKTSKKGKLKENRVVFIVNVKPESMMKVDRQDGLLYDKLFDLEINLQEINVDNYDVILEGLLNKKKETIKELLAQRLEVPDSLCDLPGISWIIRGKNLGIREIKHRLNITFSLYESLVNKFPERNFSFDKCVVAAYLTTEFEEEFYNTEDEAFSQLINLFLQGELTQESCERIVGLSSLNDDEADDNDESVKRYYLYYQTLCDLIKAKLIDHTYRTYFYNYPRNSLMYDSDAMQVYNAILYGEGFDKITDVAQRVVNTQLKVVVKALQERERLTLLLPDGLFDIESLYLTALQYKRDMVFEYFNTIDYTEASPLSAIGFFEKLLTYDEERDVYTKDIIIEFCDVWEEHFEETSLQRLRSSICEKFPSEILWYKQLFFNGHQLLTFHELQSISIEAAVQLVDYESEYFSEKQISIFFDEINDSNVDILRCRGALKDLLDHSRDYLKDKDLIPYYIGFMNLYSIIIPEYELSIMDYIKEIREKIEDGVIDDTEPLEGLISSYKEIITGCSEKLSDQTLHNIGVIDSYNGYDKNVANQLLDRSFIYEYVLVMLNLDNLIDFTDIRIHNSIEEHYNDIKQRDVEFKKLRMEVLGTSENTIESYLFLFDHDNSTMTQEELKVLSDNIDDCDRWVIRLIPSEVLTEDNYLWVAGFFNGKGHDCDDSFEILKYVLSSDADIAEKMFYSLDFNSIKYRPLTNKQKSMIIDLGKDCLRLNSTSGKIRFMERTRYLDEKFEIEMLEEVRADKALQEQYVRIVKDIGKLPKHSARFLNKLDCYYSFGDGINNVFLECGCYLYYIISDTNYHSVFNMPRGDMLITLWPYYIKIFSSSSFEKTRKKMTNNSDFLELVMRKEEYIDFLPENRMQLCGISQDARSVRNVFEKYDNVFAIKYFSHMKGFANQNAAQEFIDLIRNYKEVLLSDEVYNNIYPLLNDKKLKRNYTNMRKHLKSEN